MNQRDLSPHTLPARQRALITGASSGIGLAYARALAARGYDLLLVSNQETEQCRIAEELSATYGIDARPLCMDLSHGEAARELYDYCTKESLEIEILINNAGIFFFNDVTETAVSRLETMTGLHMTTPTLLCHYFGAAMKQRGHGHILNMASMAATFAVPGIAVYAASKSYLKIFSKALYNELYDYGVSVTVLCPGAVDTDLYGLAPHLRRLGVRLGILMPPERLVQKGLRAMFHGKRCVMPGAINRLFVLIPPMLPSPLVRWIKRHARFYRYGKQI